jgi:ribosome-binding protein aMBF1 (putative translation factor)
MIRNDKEYQAALQRLQEDRTIAELQRKALQERGLSPDEIAHAMEPLEAFTGQLEDEVAWYDRARSGDLGVVRQLTSIGRLLIALRIARGLSQRDLAEKLGVDESQVSRDERNEYFNITLTRAQRIVDVLGAETETRVVTSPSEEDEVVVGAP